MEFLELPDELIEKILKYTSGKDILRLFSTCKSIAKLIGDSSNLMQKLTLYVNNELIRNLDSILNSGRKYQNIDIKFGENMLCDVFDILERFAEPVKNLTIHHSTIKSNEIQRILNICRKLDCFKLRKVQYIENLTSSLDYGHEKSINLLELDESCFQILQHFTSSSVKQFDVICYQEESDNIHYFIKFLESQKGMRKLSVQGTMCYHLFLNDYSENFKFSLKHLTIKFLVFMTRAELSENFAKFLIKQSKSLITFNFDFINDTILEIILNEMENLKSLGLHSFGKKLRLDELNPDNLNVNSTIETLEFNYCQEFPFEEIIKFTPNVKQLKLKVVQISFNFIASIFHDLQNLKSLVIVSCKFQNYLWLPTVKDVYFEEMDSRQIVKFLMVNRHIEKLVAGRIDNEILKALKYHKNLKYCVSTMNEGGLPTFRRIRRYSHVS